MKLMWFGDLAATGFGSVTQDFGRALLAMGHDVRFISMNEMGDLPEPFASRTFAVNDPDGWVAMAQRGGIHGLMDGSLWPDAWVPDAAVILGDFVGVRLVVMASPQSREVFGRIPTFHYMPVEGVDLPPRWREMWDIVTPVAMSGFGAEQIARVTGKRPAVVYHGVDTDQFRPISAERPLYMKVETDEGIVEKTLRSQADCKRFFGSSPNTYWLLRTDRLMPRKAYPSLLRALAPVLAARPDTILVTHCRTVDEGGDFTDLRSKYPPAIRSRMLNTGFHDQVGGASRDILTALYNAADLYVTVSAEGFGLTIAEAIACGTPAVGLEYSAVPEVIGPAGAAVKVDHLVDSEYGFPWAIVDEPEYGRVVAGLLADHILRIRLGTVGPPHVQANFTWDRSARALTDLLEATVKVEVAA